MTRVISVKPVANGWSLQSDGVDGDMMFLSGAKAEAAARALAGKLAGSGESSEIRIYVRDGALAARFTVHAKHGALSAA